MSPTAETSLLDTLLAPLLHLAPAERLEAITRLAQSLKPTPVAASTTILDFIGAWANDPEADKMEQAIAENRHFTNKSELMQWQ